MAKVELKIDGTKIENFRYRRYAQKTEMTPDQVTRLIKAFEAIMDEEPKKA